MKRSNIIFIILIATLFVTPFIMLGVYSFFPGKPTLVLPDCRIVQIHNPALAAKDVHIKSPEGHEPLKINGRSFFPRSTDNNHIRYSGQKTYRPDLNHTGDTLHIGAPQKAGNDTNLKLYIRIYGLEKVELNGTEIWDDGQSRF
jgi:hypothetical protein